MHGAEGEAGLAGVTASTEDAQAGGKPRRSRNPLGLRTRGKRAAVLAERLGLRFDDPALLELALTHRSALNDLTDDAPQATLTNERLEFLGDAVLGLAASKFLYATDPEAPEGVLTQRRVGLVRAEALVRWAREIGLAEALTVGHGERPGEGARDRMLAGAFEALIGAIALDQGDVVAERFVTGFLEREVGEGDAEPEGAANPKGDLQMALQARHRASPTYRVVDTEGPDHQRVFTVEVVFRAETLGVGKGGSKREAEQRAAEAALAALGPDTLGDETTSA